MSVGREALLENQPPLPREQAWPRIARTADPTSAGCVHEPLGTVEGVAVTAVLCRKQPGSWATSQYFSEYGLAIPRQGGFWRRVRGRVGYVDAATAFFDAPNVVQEIGHHVDGVQCTLLALSERAVAELTGDGVPSLEAIPTTPAVDVAHRALIAGLRHQADTFELQECLVRLVGGITECVTPGRLATRRSRAEAAHIKIVDHIREAIADDPVGVDLGTLAASLNYSRYHVIRVFRRVTGTTLTQHRNRVRIVRALDRLADGEQNLAALAADLGFVDQSHMVHVVKGATGSPPSRLRRLFREPGRARRLPAARGADGR